MSNAPEELKYAESHEWASLDSEGIVTVGISEHAQDALGDVVFVELPEVGQEVSAGEEAAVVESVKAASDIYAPVSGVVIAVNELLVEEPETVNSAPYGEGWFFRVKTVDATELDSLMSAKDYLDSVE